jgi:TctA family transporter
MELSPSLLTGLHEALATPRLLACFAGAVVGTAIGVLPRLGALAVLALLLPLVRWLDPTSALILLAAVVYGSQYGASTTAILMQGGDPGNDSGSAADGYQMACQGRGGVALTVAALGSCFAGCVVTLLLALLAQPLTELAFRFGAPEYFALMVLGLVGAAVFASGSVLKALCMAVLGLLLAQIGTDAVTHEARFVLGFVPLVRPEGLGFVVVALGLFGIGQILVQLAARSVEGPVAPQGVTRPALTAEDAREAVPSVLRGTVLGALLGVLPGAGAALASFASYLTERRLTQQPRVPFGRGAIQGVAGPESANNAGAQASFIPVLTLGIPPNALMALIAGAMMLHGLTPGPQIISTQPVLFWGLVASMWVGNALLLLLNLPLVGVWSRLLVVRYRWVVPALVLLAGLGAYSLRGSVFDVEAVAVIALAAAAFHALGCEPAPLLLGYVLAGPMEDNLRRTLALSGGDWGLFITRPWSAGFLAVAALLIVGVMLPSIRTRREEAFHEG